MYYEVVAIVRTCDGLTNDFSDDNSISYKIYIKVHSYLKCWMSLLAQFGMRYLWCMLFADHIVSVNETTTVKYQVLTVEANIRISKF